MSVIVPVYNVGLNKVSGTIKFDYEIKNVKDALEEAINISKVQRR